MMFYFFLHKNLHFVPPLMGGDLKCVLMGGERGEKKSGVLIGVENHTTLHSTLKAWTIA